VGFFLSHARRFGAGVKNKWRKNGARLAQDWRMPGDPAQGATAGVAVEPCPYRMCSHVECRKTGACPAIRRKGQPLA